MKPRITIFIIALIFTLLNIGCNTKKELTTTPSSTVNALVMHVAEKANNDGDYNISLMNYAAMYRVSKKTKNYEDILSVLKYGQEQRCPVIITIGKKDGKTGNLIISAEKVKDKKQ